MSDAFQILGQVPEFQHQFAGDWKPMPSIYAIEVTASCDLQCPMCLRTSDMTNKKPKLLKMDLLELMLRRGEFEGSSYVELQLAGEPTIHPDLDAIIRFMSHQAKVLVGMSTHGLNMAKRSRKGKYVAETLLDLDALTLSVDSVDPVTYSKMRYPAQLANLIESLDFFFGRVSSRASLGYHVPFIECQLVVAPGVVAHSSGETEALAKLMDDRGWNRFASIRTTQDCFIEMRSTIPVKAGSVPRAAYGPSGICINPFLTCNISQDGDVVSCCYIFDQDQQSINYYGNLYKESLLDIWNGPRVKAIRQSLISGKLQGQCAQCYYPSPVKIHHNIVSRLVKSQR